MSSSVGPPGANASEEEQLAWAMQESLKVAVDPDAGFTTKGGVPVRAPKKASNIPAVLPPPLPAVVDVKVRQRTPLPTLPMIAPERGQAERDLALRLCLQPVVLARITASVSLVDSVARTYASAWNLSEIVATNERCSISMT